jgi:hypothetical protein
MRGISWLAEDPLASQGGPCSMELVSWFVKGDFNQWKSYVDGSILKEIPTGRLSAVLWVRWLVVCVVPPMPMFDPRPVCLGFLVEEAGLGQVSLRVFRFPMSVSFHQCSILIRLWRYAILRIESVVKWHTLKNRAPVEYICKLLPLLEPVRQNLRNWQPLSSTSRYLLLPAVLAWSFSAITGEMDALMNWCNEPGALFPFA